MDILDTIVVGLAESALREQVIWALFNVPGLPPVVQAIHIFAVAIVMGTVVFLNLRILGIAVPSQVPAEMANRLLPWLWWMLPVLLMTGSVFVVARPGRYFLNLIFGIKMTALAAALVLALGVRFGHWLEDRESFGWPLKVQALVSTALWVLVMLAGRWIAYVDYLFWPEDSP